MFPSTRSGAPRPAVAKLIAYALVAQLGIGLIAVTAKAGAENEAAATQTVSTKPLLKDAGGPRIAAAPTTKTPVQTGPTLGGLVPRFYGPQSTAPSTTPPSSQAAAPTQSAPTSAAAAPPPPATTAPASTPPASSGSTAQSAGAVGNRQLADTRALWMSIGQSPTDDQISFAATHYRVAIVNVWETAAAQRLKQLNPKIIVLAYQDLSSTRSYVTDDAQTPTGITYKQAEAHPSWFAVDSSGGRIQWNGYGGHWQAAVWDPTYQNQWVHEVTDRIGSSPFDGIFADNALDTVKWYFGGSLGNGKTDADVRNGISQLISMAAQSLHAKGKLIIPNIPDGLSNPAWWNQLTGIADGGMEEMFMHWSDDPNSGFVEDAQSNGFDQQVANISRPGLILVRTSAAADDDQSYRYGLASFWLSGAAERAAYSATTHDGYVGTPFRPEQAWDLGAPSSDIQRQGSVRFRSFQNGFAAANPSGSNTQTISLPGGLIDGNGQSVSSVTLGPHSGAVFRRG